MNFDNVQAFRLDGGEHMVLKFRKHWLILLRDSIGTIAFGLLPLLALPLIAPLLALLGVTSALFPASFIAFLYAWWLLMVWLALSVIWTNYYLDLWLVTDKRIVSIDQLGLFNRTVTTFPFANIQDVTVEQHGIFQTLLNFGTVTVQTAGPTTKNMVIVGVARPSRVRDTIVHETEGWRRRNSTRP